MATKFAPKVPEPTPLDVVKDYLRVTDDVEDAKIQAMIPRARLWVEEHTGIAIVQRQFSEFVVPRSGVVRLSREPLRSLSSVAYNDNEGVSQTVTGIACTPPSTKLTGSWPSSGDAPLQVTYIAGLWDSTTDLQAAIDAGTIDARLIGAMLTLIEGEYSAGFAYPPETITAAVNALFYLKFVAP